MMANKQLGENRDGSATMASRFRSSAKRGRGASATELIILLVLISLVCIGIFRLFGDTITAKLSGAQAEVSAVGGGDRPFDGNFGESGSASGGRSSGSSSGGSNSKSTGSTASGSASSGSNAAVAKAPTAVDAVEAKPGSVGGFNPWILVIFIGLGGVLVYVFFAKKSG